LTINNYDVLQSQLIPIEHIRLPKQPQGYAAILVPLYYEHDEWHIILTLRADHLRHHSGEVAFPGGMWEDNDSTPVITALRESEEEIALPVDQVCVLGALDEMHTRRLTHVRPIVGIIPNALALKANKSETETIFTVPLNFFLQDERLRTDIFPSYEHSPQKGTYWVPAYDYNGYEIWGLTASVIVQLLNRCFGANISREHHSREKFW
jgi:8-oxo-dGTP pyrophosphatase MutT (NUDIX family)